MKTTKNRFTKTAALLLGLSIGWVGCKNDPIGDLSPQDSQVFITNHDPSANFSEYRTFSVVDSVAVLGNQGNNRLSATTRELIFINRITESLLSRGFVQVARTAKPDLGINVARISNSYVNVVANNFNYGGYGSNYWGYGGYGNYYYPPSYSYYQVDENYWYVEAIDLKNPVTSQSGQSQLKAVWSAEIRGNGIFDETSLSNIVDAVFAQSDYFRAGR
ncbi:MAG: DUF4136 domain-containing protein [Cytophagaceae bacterium]|nr:DUF4136 domain-containing protein [Cytophagaceae bacterium]